MAASKDRKHTVVALVEDKPGVLNRVVSLFRRRGFNIVSLTVGPSEMPGLSRLTIVVGGDTVSIEQVVKQLYKLIEVVKVNDLSDDEMIAIELALVKVHATASTRGEIMQLTEIYKARIVDVSLDSLVVEIAGTEDKIDSLLVLLRPFGLKEIVRTGRIAMSRGGNAMQLEEAIPVDGAAFRNRRN